MTGTTDRTSGEATGRSPGEAASPSTDLAANRSTVAASGAAIRVFIVDDEALARVRLRSMVTECSTPKAEVVGETGTVAHALAWLAEHQCDLLLLDIQMPGADGMQLAASLRARAAQGESVPAVVFVTAHAQHALRAFELEATDYLTKPVRRERLQATLARVGQRLSLHAGTASAMASQAALQPLNRGRPPLPGDASTASTVGNAAGESAAAGPHLPSSPVLVVSERGRIVRVPLVDVLYLKAELKYVTLRTSQHTYVLDDALSDLEQRLGDPFMRVHRNALVARRAVRSLERRMMAVEGDEDTAETWAVRIEPVGEWLAVSRRQLPAVREAIAARGV